MRNQTVCELMLSILLLSILSMILTTGPVEAGAGAGTIYIRSDGSFDPPSAPINRVGNLYTLTGDITNNVADAIVIQANNIILDGAGFTIHGSISSKSSGIYMSQAFFVVVKHLSIDSCFVGIYLEASSFNTITINKLASNNYGMRLVSSNYNTITCNNITSNLWGIYLLNCQSNLIFHNNLMNSPYYNAFVTWDLSSPSGNTWDNGYPSGGNYWSDYNGFDYYKGPSQNIPGIDGIGDTPLTIDTNNIDHYPLKTSYGTYHLTIQTNDPDAGTTNPTLGTHQYETGTEVEVTATPNPGFTFAYWKLGQDNLNDNPTKVLMNRDLTLQAVFTPPLAVPVAPFGIIGALITMIFTLVCFAGFKRNRQSARL